MPDLVERAPLISILEFVKARIGFQHFVKVREPHVFLVVDRLKYAGCSGQFQTPAEDDNVEVEGAQNQGAYRIAWLANSPNVNHHCPICPTPTSNKSTVKRCNSSALQSCNAEVECEDF